MKYNILINTMMGNMNIEMLHCLNLYTNSFIYIFKNQKIQNYVLI